MMVALLLCADAVGERSARAIERRCAEDVALRVICANHTPDHATIARFRARHEAALGATLHPGAGPVSPRPACSVGRPGRPGWEPGGGQDAAPGASRQLPGHRRPDPRRGRPRRRRRGRAPGSGPRRRAAGRAGQPQRAPDLPGAAARSSSRPSRPPSRPAMRPTWPGGPSGRPSTGAARRAQAHATRSGCAGAAHGLHDRPRHAPPRPARWNCAAGLQRSGARQPQQVILATEVTQAPNDSGQLAPLVAEARADRCRRDRAADRDRRGRRRLLERAGHRRGPHRRNRGARADRQPGPHRTAKARSPARQEARRIEQVLASPEGAALYRARQQIVEPIFAQTSSCAAWPLQRRGLAACRAEWRLIAATHNLLKLWRAGGALQPA